MIQPSVSDPTKFEMNGEQAAKWLIVAFLIVVAVVALLFARRLIAPVDGLITQQACSIYGEDELSRQSTGYETSNRFSLIDRTHGQCEFGPVVEFDEDGEVIDPVVDEDAADETVDAAGSDDEDADVAADSLVVSLVDIETSGLYRAAKILFAILQLGAASAAVRLLADPLFDRFVRKP